MTEPLQDGGCQGNCWRISPGVPGVELLSSLENILTQSNH
jgi:hypothetical protein